MPHPSMESNRTRRDFLRGAAALVAGVVTAGMARSAGALQPPAKGAAKAGAARSAKTASAAHAITIYKDPNCGCCKLWVDHMREAGFTPTVHDTADMASVKASMGVPHNLESCHTARVGGYTIEGHVPADVIERALREKPAGRGLAVPGMPMGSPGMEGPRKDKYDIILFDQSGKGRVYASR